MSKRILKQLVKAQLQTLPQVMLGMTFLASVASAQIQMPSWWTPSQPQRPAKPAAQKPKPAPAPAKPVAAKPAPAAAPTPVPAPIPQTALGMMLSSSKVQLGRTSLNVSRLRSFYQIKGYNPYFTDANGITANGIAVRAFLISEPVKHGLRAGDYLTQDLEARVAAKDPRVINELELILANSLIQISSDIGTGRTNPEDDSQNVSDFEMKKRSFNDYAALDAAAMDPSQLAATMAALAPQTQAYQRMSQILVNLVNVRAAGGWPALRQTKTLKPGMTDASVPAIRVRLVDLGVLLDTTQRNNPSQVYDSTLANAVQWFQEGMKLSMDGVLGSSSYSALNISLDMRINQLRANLERWRLLPHDLGNEYVFVDLGKQEWKLYKGGQIMLQMRNINGKTDRQTPSFVDEVNEVIVNPYWNAPASIVVKDILPAALSNPDYFNEMRMRVFQNGREIDPSYIDWSQYSLSYLPPYSFREEPGDNNSLGRVKFNLAINQHDIYMHDTNHHELFSQDLRLFSSGCIRLERPRDFANYLLGQQGISPDDLEYMINDPSVVAKEIRLTHRTKAYIVALTTAVDPSGIVRFGPDIYGQDVRFVNALEGVRVDPSSVSPRNIMTFGAP